ncbi:MAG: hypothetical protein JWQ21_2596 [Herminiimonas sp.]|nr:hypothetical protein [Herminiimonas sp.]
MNFYKWFITSFVFSIAAAFSSSLYAMPVMDIHIEDLMLRASDIQKSLMLNPNQQLLWQQVESKSRAILRARQTRRGNLQADLLAKLDVPTTELRDMAAWVNKEADLTMQEDRQLRELWLTVNDALDDHQRQTVLSFLADELVRVADQDRGHKAEKSDGQTRGRGMGRSKQGGGMGGGMQ